MKKYFYLLVVIMISGCVTTGTTLSPASSYKKLTNTDIIQVGMTLSEVKNILGDNLTVGYSRSPNAGEAYEPIYIKQPFRAEILKGNGKQYEVVHYYTSIRKSDGLLADDELTPIVFENGRVVGKGHDYLFDLKSNM